MTITPRHRVSHSTRLDVPAAVAYAVIADYRRHHPHILPDAFMNLTVDEGGTGAGTRISFDLCAAGVTKHYRQVISEPEPGRVLVEADLSGASTTSFTIDTDGAGCQVTIATEFETSDGIAGAIERRLAGSLLRRIYAAELALLSTYASGLQRL